LKKDYGGICLKNGLWSKECKLKVVARDTGEWGFFVKEVDGFEYELYSDVCVYQRRKSVKGDN